MNGLTATTELTWRATLMPRLIAGLIGAACIGVLAFAGTLHPSPDGIGTHQQLGLGPCSLLVQTGVPCPTCGVTTAFAHAAHGKIIAAIIVQPAGGLAAILMMLTAIGCGVVVLTGEPIWRWLMPVWQWRVYSMLMVTAAVGLAWAYKIVMVKGWPI